MPRTILSIARDQILLETRRALLRKSGHRVVSLSDPGAFHGYVQENPVDLVVLGHSLTRQDRQQIYGSLSDLNLRATVIELYATASPPNSPAQFFLAVHDQGFEADLLALVKQVLSGNSN